jgi:uncharacterized phage protein (TIGR01671 family)
MREIKFRAYIPQMKRACLGGKGLTLNDIRKLDESYFRDDVVWVEFTGLHDKNDKGIYEGDIVKTQYDDLRNLVIIFRDGGFCPSGDYKEDAKGLGIVPDNSLLYESEVIGNIYENPELLEAK